MPLPRLLIYHHHRRERVCVWFFGGGVQTSWCLPDKGTMTMDAEIQLTAQLVIVIHIRIIVKSRRNAPSSRFMPHFKISLWKKLSQRRKFCSICFGSGKKKTSGIARDTVRALTLTGIFGHMTFLPRSRPNCPQKKSPRRVRQEQTRTTDIQPRLKSLSFTILQVSCFHIHY